jgi:hypothetical protein
MNLKNFDSLKAGIGAQIAARQFYVDVSKLSTEK